jgi:hypothetical protein
MKKVLSIVLLVSLLVMLTVSVVSAKAPEVAAGAPVGETSIVAAGVTAPILQDEPTNYWADLGTTILYELAKYFLPILALSLVTMVITWAKKGWQEIKSRAGEDLAYFMEQAADIAVKAAEQMKIKDYIKDKKTTALEIAQGYLNSHGFKNFDLGVLGNLIEAKVIENFPVKTAKTK